MSVVENNITTNDDIQSLCYEALAELYPGGGRKIIERSKAWKFIHGSLQVIVVFVCMVI